jgi:hypothetical protein
MLDKIKTETNYKIGIFIVTADIGNPFDFEEVYSAFNNGKFQTIMLLIGPKGHHFYNIELTKLGNGLIKESTVYNTDRELVEEEYILKLYGKKKTNNTDPEYIPLIKQTRNNSLYSALSSRGNSKSRKRSHKPTNISLKRNALRQVSF